MTPKLTPNYDILSSVEARQLPPRRARRNWKPIIETLATRLPVFSTDFTDADIKYLTLVFAYRRSDGLRVRSRREVRHGQPGRVVWTEPG